jgi:hypothetical protein
LEGQKKNIKQIGSHLSLIACFHEIKLMFDVLICSEGSLMEVQCKLERELEIANKIILDKLPFIDTSKYIIESL